jgi:hypothetical protein
MSKNTRSKDCAVCPHGQPNCLTYCTVRTYEPSDIHDLTQKEMKTKKIDDLQLQVLRLVTLRGQY